MAMNVYVLITGCDSEALALPSTAFFLLPRYPPRFLTYFISK